MVKQHKKPEIMKQDKKPDGELYFVEVTEPDEIRRHMLQSLRDILGTLQKFERMYARKNEKLAKIQRLRELMRESHKLMGVLKTRLPQTNIKPHFERHVQKEAKEAPKEEKKPKAKEQPKSPKKMTEMERLEAELSAIEGKLKQLV